MDKTPVCECVERLLKAHIALTPNSGTINETRLIFAGMARSKRSAVIRNTRAPAELTEEQKIRFAGYDVYG